jgi:hypothetical protein
MNTSEEQSAASKGRDCFANCDCIHASRKTKLWERIWDIRSEKRETLLHLVHREILEINEMSAISLRVHSTERPDVGGLDTPKNDIQAAWLAGKL